MLCGLGAWGLAPPSEWAECLSAASCRPAVRVVGTVPAAAGAVSESWSCFRKALNTSVVGRGLFHVVTFEDSVLKILPPRAPVSEELCPVPRVTRIGNLQCLQRRTKHILSSFLPSPFSRMPLSTKWLEFWYLFLYCLRLHSFIFGEGKGEREGEKHQCVVASRTPPTGDLATPGVHPDWGSNQQPFGSQAGAQPLSHTSRGSLV